MNSRSRVPHQRNSIFPDLGSEDGWERFHHKDLATLTPERAWAETHVLTHWLAQFIFERQHPRYIYDGGEGIREDAWVRERISRLRTIVSGRRAA